MNLLGFQFAEGGDYRGCSSVDYYSERGEVQFVTDNREQDLTIKIKAHAGADIRLVAEYKLGLGKRELRPLWDKVRAHEPEAVGKWLSDRMGLITRLLSDPKFWTDPPYDPLIHRKARRWWFW